MPNLLIDLVAHVLQALEILARIRNPALGLLATFFIFGDARSLFDERSHVVGFRLDDARDHPLLDNRVTARAQTSAEEELRDVLAAATRTIQEVVRAAIARYDALQGYFAVFSIRAGDLAIRVIENEFDRGAAHGLARARAVKDHIGHRVAAQVLGRQFAHHPAHRIDDVGFAAAIRPYDASQIAREGNRCRIDERFETGELNLR
jgi:hypothetical protein